MLLVFRSISVLEGISYLLILSVTLGFISRDYVAALGMTHGLLFIGYQLVAFSLANKQGWSIWQVMMLFVASLLPLAFVPVEIWLRKQQQLALAS
ncbi:DUF3817 domain-containing protein [Oceanobacter mangrovi]|uniref:DUF3817 domain-containing protein n=1 Tax=Oceanobacter mangrovi TaxID=2862510 RepID=UPI001C8DE395|nr:DUF3817 domain-containing protein [Oceanobacter mangrovi]